VIGRSLPRSSPCSGSRWTSRCCGRWYGRPSIGGLATRLSARCPLDVVQEAENVVADTRDESWCNNLASDQDYVVPRRIRDPPRLLAWSAGRTHQLMFNHAAGRFDAIAALDLRSDVAQVVDLSGRIILIDVSLVTTVTPSGAATMLELLRMVRSRGGDLRMFVRFAGLRKAPTKRCRCPTSRGCIADATKHRRLARRDGSLGAETVAAVTEWVARPTLV